jgi:hypothetical protein
MKLILSQSFAIFFLSIACPVIGFSDTPTTPVRDDVSVEDRETNSLTEHAYVIYEHTFDKDTTLKFILLCVRGKHQLVCFQKVPAKQKGDDIWQWKSLKQRKPTRAEAEITRLSSLISSPSLPPTPPAADEAINAVVQAASKIQDIPKDAGFDQVEPHTESAKTEKTQNGLDDVPVTFATYTLNKPPFIKPSDDTTGAVETTDYSPFYRADKDHVRIKKRTDIKPEKTTNDSVYAYVASWILANYAANNTTSDAQKGDEVIGLTFLHADKYVDPGTKTLSLHFTSCYFATGKSKDTTITHSFDPVTIGKDLSPNVDTNALAHYIIGPNLSALTSEPANNRSTATKPGNTASSGGAEVTPLPKDADVGKPSALEFPYGLPKPGFPSFKTDSTGTDATITLTFAPKDPPPNPAGGNNSDNKKNTDGWSLANPFPTLSVNGGTYLDKDFYNVTVSPMWTWKHTDKDAVPLPAPGAACLTEEQKKAAALNKIDFDSVTAGGQYSRSLQPIASGVKLTQGEMATASVKGSDRKGSFSYAIDEAAGYNTNSNEITGKQAVNTGEYSGATHAQELWHAYLNTKNLNMTDRPDVDESNSAGSGDGVNSHMISMEFDLSQWVKPASVTQNSNFYTSAAANAHFGADVPVDPTFFSGIENSPEFLRVDASLTGGGIMGESPDNDRFYGGNTSSAGGVTDAPSPVVRSFGTGKLGLLPASKLAVGKTAGAISYANANVTIAFPLPGLARRFLTDEEASTLNNLFTDPCHPLPDNDSNQDQINYIANYDDLFSLRPVFTCDAAWLGGPAYFRDRNLVSVGGGAELSCTVINFDILYEVTLHDSYARQQPLGENIIAQISYDIHF